MIISFYNEAILKKTFHTSDATPVDKATMCNDAAAELDRLTRTKKLSPPNLNSSS